VVPFHRPGFDRLAVFVCVVCARIPRKGEHK
jgi:hypothetical protein